MKIIVTADDLGASEPVNQAILRGLASGLISRASLIPNGIAIDDAISKLADTEHCVGLHFVLTEGPSISEGIRSYPKLYDGRALCHKKSSLRFLSSNERRAIQDELNAQIEFLQARGVELSYVDSHHHVHTDPFIYSIFSDVLIQRGISQIRPARTDQGKSMLHLAWKKRVNKSFSRSQLKFADALIGLKNLEGLILDTHGDQVVELMLHPSLIQGKLLDLSQPDRELLPLLAELLEGRELISTI